MGATLFRPHRAGDRRHFKAGAGAAAAQRLCRRPAVDEQLRDEHDQPRAVPRLRAAPRPRAVAGVRALRHPHLQLGRDALPGRAAHHREDGLPRHRDDGRPGPHPQDVPRHPARDHVRARGPGAQEPRRRSGPTWRGSPESTLPATSSWPTSSRRRRTRGCGISSTWQTPYRAPPVSDAASGRGPAPARRPSQAARRRRQSGRCGRPAASRPGRRGGSPAPLPAAARRRGTRRSGKN